MHFLDLRVRHVTHALRSMASTIDPHLYFTVVLPIVVLPMVVHLDAERERNPATEGEGEGEVEGATPDREAVVGIGAGGGRGGEELGRVLRGEGDVGVQLAGAVGPV